jgi:stage V sporulation protein G
MNITVEKIHRLPEGSQLKAFVDLSIDNVLLIKGLRIINGKTGLFVTMPQEQGRDKRWYDMVRCLTPELKEQLDTTVLSAYHQTDE